MIKHAMLALYVLFTIQLVIVDRKCLDLENLFFMPISKTMCIFIFIISFSYAQTSDFISDVEELNLVLEMVDAIDKEPQDLTNVILENIGSETSVIDPTCKSQNKTKESHSNTKVVKKSPSKISFYTKITGPVDDMRLANLENNSSENFKNLRDVILAQNDSARNSAISELCKDKSNIEKIQMGSTLFHYLGGVYNDGLAGGGSDPFTEIDPTKNPDQTQMITLQRQYNALNARFYGGDFVETGGVCRHASTLVSDFLTKCGFDSQLINQVGYRTAETGHATVKVVDPVSGKTYFLNWGEFVSLESENALTNFDVPSGSIPSSGMIIQLYSPDEQGKLLGNVRTNEGVVVARLLGTANDKIDFSTYMTTEAGVLVNLGQKEITYSSGKMKLIDQELSLNYINGRNHDFFGREQMMNGLGIKYKRDAEINFSNHFFWKNKLQSSLGFYHGTKEKSFFDDIIKNETKGLAFAQVGGMSIGKKFHHPQSITTVELGADMVGEIYTIRSKSGVPHSDEVYNNVDYNYYVIGKLQVTHERKKDHIHVEGMTRATVHADMQWNEKKPVSYATVYNPEINIIYSRKLDNNQKIGAHVDYVGSFDRQFMTADVFYNNDKINLSSSGGFRVIKTANQNHTTYAIVKVNKEFQTKKIDLKAGVDVQQPLEKKSPYVMGTVVLTPHFTKKKAPLRSPL